MVQILIIEDDQDIREILSFNLENAGYSVLTAGSTEQGEKLLTDSTSLLLLDVMLPGESGFQFARRLKNSPFRDIPIIFLTARSSENDLLTGFSAGGDDYIAKPFSINEVLARIKAVLKRSAPQAKSSDCADFQGLHIDFDQSTVSIDSREINLSRKEFDILALLAKEPGSYFSRSAIIERLWKDAPYVIDRTVDVHIARIRSKIGTYHDMIRNKTLFGYYLDPNFSLDDEQQ